MVLSISIWSDESVIPDMVKEHEQKNKNVK